MKTDMKTEITFIAGFAIGAAAGVLVMVLLAPTPRRKRRATKTAKQNEQP